MPPARLSRIPKPMTTGDEPDQQIDKDGGDTGSHKVTDRLKTVQDMINTVRKSLIFIVASHKLKKPTKGPKVS